MCAGAILQARIPLVVYGAADLKAGAAESLFRLLDDKRLNHRAQVVGGVMAAECGHLLTEFFQTKRNWARSKAGTTKGQDRSDTTQAVLVAN